MNRVYQKQINKDKVVNYTLMAFNDEVNDSIKTPLPYNELLDAFHDLFDEFKLVDKNYKLLNKDHAYFSSAC